jgi:hypothetical protein
MKGLSASGLADLAGTTAAEVQRLVELGILVARDGTGPFLETDVQKVAWLLRASRPGCRWRGSPRRSGPAAVVHLPRDRPVPTMGGALARTYRQVIQETGVPLELLGSALESMGFTRMAPDEPMREDELEIVPWYSWGTPPGSSTWPG